MLSTAKIILFFRCFEELSVAEKPLRTVQEPIPNDMIKEEEVASIDNEGKILDSRWE